MGIPFVVVKEYLNEFGRFGALPLTTQEYNWVDRYYPRKPFSSDTLYLCETMDLIDIEVSLGQGGLTSEEGHVSIVCVSCIQDSEEAIEEQALRRACEKLCTKDCSIVPFFTAISPGHIFYRLQNYLVKLLSWKFDMADAMLSGAMFQEILNMSADILPDPIYVTDSRYTLVASVNIQEETLPAFRELLSAGCLSEDTILRLRRQGFIANGMVPRPYQVKNAVTHLSSASAKDSFINHIFRVEGAFYLHAIMLCKKRPLTPGKRYLFEVLAENINHCVMKECYQQGGRYRMESEAVIALAHGDPSDGKALEAFAEQNGVNINKPMALVQLRGGRSTSMLALSGSLEKMFPKSLMGQGTSVLYLICNCDDEVSGTTLGELQRFCETYKVKAGVSLPFDGLSHAYFAALETDAVLALPSHVFPAEGDSPSRYISASFKQYARLCLMHVESDLRDEIIGFLVEHNPLAAVVLDDAKTSGCTMKFIALYLSSFGNAASVANALGVHRNSIYNKIARINKLYGVDLSKEDDRAFAALLLDLMILSRGRGSV